ncbi:putative Mg2+ transporter-C (MgtC) family protein [Pseudomonas taetrolens]|uniref:Protein MgtC n=1 Tax=Pseudomonas taetrolens TaxID=47884 RepID=A0A0J6GNV9_PSETA|nr:MgtC/SapB family protein [Pseudomonas taetrolens]KMM83819.1 methyltransferase [Pseudomonas taetrolens]SEB93091.1 putative Mg2+ transporter-C (MgtC) family protein [Pseudomonas taetrolens]SQF85630.1 Mg2+ transporter [Pseudomonas taetrolens]VEH48707.1 Mg2+ transporter [Pseudomonas taetrolens]
MISDWEMCLRLLLAVVLGSLVGFQREHLFWTAGLRTHMLVATGSCLFMMVSAFGFQQALTQTGTQLDPSRIAAQVVTGIGFLGAGSILLRGEVIKGLTTAASLWAVAAIGLAVGGGLYVLGTVATLIILTILVAIGPLEKKYRDYMKVHVIKLVAPAGSLSLMHLKQILGERAGCIRQVIVEQGVEKDFEDVTIEFRNATRPQAEAMLQILLNMEGVREAPHSD